MKTLVTGHKGLVGSNLIKRLDDVVVFPDDADLKDENIVDNFFMENKPEVVYHLAALAAESRGQVSPVQMTQNNIGIFVNVLKASINARVKHFVYTSSVAVYGEAVIPYKEDGLTIPKDVYGVNKLACEQILKIMAKVYGFTYTIFRPHNIYGPGQNMSDPYKNVVALFMRSLLLDLPYKLYGNGEMRRAFSYVDDVVDVLAQSLDLQNVTMNVGSDAAISIRELSDMVQEISDIQGKVEHHPARPQEISMFLADHSLQNVLVDYKETPLFEGLQKTWEWVKAQDLQELETTTNEIH